MAKTPWKEYPADGGSKYWYNTETQESVWDTPEEIQKILDSVKSDAEQPSYIIRSDGSYKDLSQYVSDSPLAPANAKPYSSDTEKVLAFKDLLREKQVDETWTFAKVMKHMVTEPRYWAIQHSVIRKQSFDEYLVESKREHEERKRAERRENMDRMISALKNYSEFTYYTKWRTAKEILDQDPVFQVADVKERKTAFHSYVRDLRAEHYRQLDKARIAAMKLLEERFQELEVSSNSRWIETFATIKPELDEKEFKPMDKLDVLTAYSTYIKDVERNYIEERQNVKRIQRRKERKIRQAFCELLESLRAEGKIKAGTKWTSVLPLFQEDQRYLDICGQPGSSPLELFWDITEEEDRKLKLQRELVLDVVTAKRFAVDSEASLEMFVKVVSSDSRGVDISEANLKVIFEDLKRLSCKRREQDKHADGRWLRRNQDALRVVFKDLDPPITLEDKWEDVKKRVEDSEEYKALPSEESRVDAFERHLRRLKERGRDRDYDREREREREREQRNRERSERWDRDHRRSNSRDRRRPRRNSRSSNNPAPLPPYPTSTSASGDRPPPSEYYQSPPYYEDPRRPYLEY